MTTTAIDEFLAARHRYAMLTTLRRDGSPTTIPVWFDWTGEAVEMFAAQGSLKLSRITRDPRVTVTVANEVDEPEFWVAFDGEAEMVDGGGFDLAERLAPLYWDLTQPERVAALEAWRQEGNEAFQRIVVRPTAVRSYNFD